MFWPSPRKVDFGKERSCRLQDAPFVHLPLLWSCSTQSWFIDAPDLRCPHWNVFFELSVDLSRCCCYQYSREGCRLALSSDMAIELVRIRTAQQYPMLMPKLFPGELATRERHNDCLAIWTTFFGLNNNTTSAINGDAFASVSQAPNSHVPYHVTISVPTVPA